MNLLIGRKEIMAPRRLQAVQKLYSMPSSKLKPELLLRPNLNDDIARAESTRRRFEVAMMLTCVQKDLSFGHACGFGESKISSTQYYSEGRGSAGNEMAKPFIDQSRFPLSASRCCSATTAAALS